MSNPSLKQRSLILLLSVAVASQVDASSLTSIGHSAPGGGPPSDGSCGNSFAGNGKGLRCSNNGCCSQWGWCGSKAEHCAVGCQSAFGRCDAFPSTGLFSMPHPGPSHGRAGHMRGPGGFKWRGVPKEMHKHKGGRKFSKGKHHRGKGDDSDSNSDSSGSDSDSDSGSDSDSEDEHHHHHHHHHHGMGMGHRHGHKGGRHHLSHSKHDWSDSNEHPSPPPFGKPFGRPPFGKPPSGGQHRGPLGYPPKPPFGGAHQGFGGPPRGHGGGMGRYGHKGHRFVGHVKDGPKLLRKGRPGKSFGSHGSGGGWHGRGHKSKGISGPWDRYQAHRSWGDYNNDDEFLPLGGGLYEILKEFIKAPLGDHKGKPPRPSRHAPAKTNPQIMNRPKPGGVPYGHLIKTCKDPGTVALTFDDGPFQYTSGLLDILKSNGGIRATFFVNGKNAGDLNNQAMKDTVRRMMADGHQIGSHTFSHKPLSPLSQKDKISEIIKLEDILHKIIGKKPTYMRPPGFECNNACMKLMGKMGYHVIGENLDTQDWKNMSNMQASKDIVSKAVDGADSKKNNFIVLAHDIHEATVAQLAKHMIDKFKEKGYRFVTVGECLGDAPENWYRNK